MSEIKVSVGLVLSETLGEESVLGRSPCLDADGCFLPVSSLLFHVCLCLCPSVLFLKGHLSSWIKALVTSFYLSCLFKGSVSNCSHLMRHWELRANIWVLRQNSGHNKWRQYLFPTIISFSIAKTQSSTLLLICLFTCFQILLIYTSMIWSAQSVLLTNIFIASQFNLNSGFVWIDRT